MKRVLVWDHHTHCQCDVTFLWTLENAALCMLPISSVAYFQESPESNTNLSLQQAVEIPTFSRQSAHSWR
jgi:hypothetical protein